MSNDKLRDALDALDSEEPAVQRMAACRAILREALAASKPEPQAQAEPEVVANVVSMHGLTFGNLEISVPIGTELITLQSHREAIAKAGSLMEMSLATIEAQREAIAKKDAALQACVDALHKSKQNTLASAQGFYEDYGTTKQTLDDFQDKQLIAEIDAAITQTKEAHG